MPVIPNPERPTPPSQPSADMDKNYRWRGWRVDDHPDVGGARGDPHPSLRRDAQGDNMLDNRPVIPQPQFFRRRVIRPSTTKLVSL